MGLESTSLRERTIKKEKRSGQNSKLSLVFIYAFYPPGSLICHITHRLLQCPPHWTPHQTHQQTANHSELSRPDHHRHQISWPHHPCSHPTSLAPGTIPHPLQKPPPPTTGARSFSCSAPRLWNPLPPHIRQSDTITTFKSQLKTHLFKLDYTL